jgi:hypothetical protein
MAHTRLLDVAWTGPATMLAEAAVLVCHVAEVMSLPWKHEACEKPLHLIVSVHDVQRST